MADVNTKYSITWGRRIALVALALVAACGNSSNDLADARRVAPDDGAVIPVDAHVDGRAFDARRVDARIVPDAASPDASPPDASPPDASPPDATPDAAPAPFCGDLIVNGDEQCDGTADCGPDCTLILATGQSAYVKADHVASQWFGNAVAISGDGLTMVVGAPFEGGDSSGINGDESQSAATSDSGAAYVFVQVDGAWTQQAYVKASNSRKNAVFGGSVALSNDGNTMAVAAAWNVFQEGESSNATGVGGNQSDTSAANAGAVYTFTRSGTTWVQDAYIKASNTQAGDVFGSSIALSGDGATLAVGAQSESSNATGINGNQADNSDSQSGAVYVFAHASSWSQQAYIKASDTSASANFGETVALSNDGSTLAVGAQGANEVYVFTRSVSTWSQQQALPQPFSFADQFGRAVALSSDGNTLAIGAGNESSDEAGGSASSSSDDSSGAAYVYGRATGTWSRQAHLKSLVLGQFLQMGVSIAISAAGDIVIVGSYNENGNATGINGDATDTTPNFDAGAAYVFAKTGAAGTWSQLEYVKPSDPQADAAFGSSVAISGAGDILLVGAPDENSSSVGINGVADSNASESGAAYIYQ